MKRILALLQLCTLFSFANAQSTEIDEFRNSRSAQLVESNRLFTGLHIDYASSTVKYVQADGRSTVAVLLLRVHNTQNTLVGLLKAIKDVGTRQLPDGHDYAMVYNDLTRFNQTTSSGTIIVYDVNYGNFVASSFVFSNGEMVSWEANGIPDDIAATYDVRKAHYCDSNQNGNVTWGECYKCMKDACTSSPDCMGLCEVADIFGGQCSGSIAAACVYLSIAY